MIQAKFHPRLSFNVILIFIENNDCIININKYLTIFFDIFQLLFYLARQKNFRNWTFENVE